MELKKYLLLDKKVGETPLEVLDEFKRANHTYAAVRLSYAGRLDPLASGSLLVLVGDECKKQDKYLGMDKEYEFQVALGISTDTADVLGMATLAPEDDHVKIANRIANLDIEKYNTEIQKTFIGKHTWPYPGFSSKTVNGVPLFKYALEGTLDSIEIPTKEIQIFDLKCTNTEIISSQNFFEKISEKIESIKPVTEHTKALGNDFRRPEIRERYISLQKNSPENFVVLSFTCTCTSGSYMRTLAEKIASTFDTKGLAFSIHRTQIGRYKKIGPFGFWYKKF